MYSRCSHCQIQQQVSAEQLRLGRGLLTCSACGERFDALASLADQLDAEVHQENVADFLPDLTGNKPVSRAWAWSSAVFLLVFLAQITYFEGDAWLRQPRLRTALQAVCERLACRLPDYKNLDEWAVSHSDFQTLSDRRYVFSAAITNQAAFRQACPELKLVLLDFGGQAVAERIFSARQYAPVAWLAPNETAQISLTVVTPPGVGKIGGYTFGLL